jgi:hypothetical protein
MKKPLKYISIFLVASLIILGIITYFFSPSFSTCENTIIATSLSPNKKWQLVLFERSCGATTGYSSQISLLKAEENINNESGNIYIASGFPKGYSLNWQSNFNVKISGSNNETFKKIKQLNGIEFTYE